MSTKYVRAKTGRIELLEQMLQRTTLTIQKVGHITVQDVGEKAFNNAWEQAWHAREEAIKQAVKATEERAARHLKESLEKAQREAEEEKKRALQEAILEAERKAVSVSEARDRMEADRLAKLTWALNKEKNEALQRQWDECERIKEEALAAAITETTRRLRNEFALLKELAVAKALQNAREHFKRKLEKSIKETRQECARVAAKESSRIAKLHKAEVERLNNEIEQLKQRVKDEIAARNFVQTDFRAVQRDYQRFLDYTDGKYHSDYLMRLRKHGMTFDSNWDRRDSADISIYPIPSALHRATVLDHSADDTVTLSMETGDLRSKHLVIGPIVCSTHGLCTADVHLIPAPGDDEVYHMPVSRMRMHPSSLVYFHLFEHGVGHYQIKLGA